MFRVCKIYVRNVFVLAGARGGGGNCKAFFTVPKGRRADEASMTAFCLIYTFLLLAYWGSGDGVPFPCCSGYAFMLVLVHGPVLFARASRNESDISSRAVSPPKVGGAALGVLGALDINIVKFVVLPPERRVFLKNGGSSSLLSSSGVRTGEFPRAPAWFCVVTKTWRAL